MSSLFGIGASGASGFYNGVATQSLRFDDGSSSYLDRTFLTPTNANKFTINVWVKRSNLGTVQRILGTGAYDGDGEFNFFFNTDNTLKISHYTSGGSTLVNEFITARVFRDTSSWYNIHHVFDSKADTYSGDNRQQIWVNGVRETSFTGTTVISGEDSTFNTARVHDIGRGNAQQYFDGYMSEINVVDGLALEPSSFGEFKNGIWIAKKPVVPSYGNNGFRLQFENTGTNTTSESTSNSPTVNIGDDSSGNGHNFSVSGINSYDCVPDSPENNFATMNTLDKVDLVLAEGNLKTTGAGNSFDTIRSTFAMSSGSWYAEFLCHAGTGNGNNNVGISTQSEALSGISGSNFLGSSATSYGYSDNDNVYNNGSIANSTGTTYIAGDIIGITFTGSEIKWYKNNSLIATVSSITGNDYCFTTTSYSTSMGMFANFGQDSSFAGNKTSGSANAQDSNGIGDFYFAPPTGLALCASNLPDDELPISPAQSTQAVNHFGILTYTGNTSGQTIQSGGANVGGKIDFSPDWVWTKARSTGIANLIYDTNRGATKYLQVDSQTGGQEDTGADSLTDFTTNGFIVGADTSTTGVNNNGTTYVAWNWKAGGTTPTKPYKVVVVSDSGNKYRFRNSADSATFAQSAVTLDLQEGGTYTFDLSDSSMSGHPFVFSLTSNGTHGGGSEYTTNVTKTGTAGSAGASISITVASGVATLYYYCSSHPGMGNSINTP